MAAVANNPKFAKKAGVSSVVGKEFLTADKGKKFGSGGMKKMRKFADGGYSDPDMESKAARKKRAIESILLRDSKPRLPGEDIERTDVNPVTKKLKDVGEYVTGMAMPGMPGGVGRAVRGMKKGGMMKNDDIKQDMPMMKKVASKAVKGHEKKMHGMKSGGTFRASANGVATKGKTKGTMIKMKNGGAC
jgi:hypothetical protein